MPPVKPMLAKPQPKIPTGKLYEPKWDGFRSIIFRDGDDVEIGSRNERPMTRYFPEVVDAVKANFPERVVEVRYDHMEGPRFRHTAQFVRWRPDREPRSCTYAQLEEPVSFNLAEILGGSVRRSGRG